MLSLVEIESRRRSAAMSPLSLDDQRKLLTACAERAKERVRIAAALARLPSSWQDVRRVLKELHRIVG
jgi:hypothetical protein